MDGRKGILVFRCVSAGELTVGHWDGMMDRGNIEMR